MAAASRRSPPSACRNALAQRGQRVKIKGGEHVKRLANQLTSHDRKLRALDLRKAGATSG